MTLNGDSIYYFIFGKCYRKSCASTINKKSNRILCGKNSDDLLETERVQRSIKVQPFGINNKILSRKV